MKVDGRVTIRVIQEKEQTLMSQNRRIFKRLIDDTHPSISFRSKSEPPNKNTVEFYIQKNYHKQKQLYHQNLKIVNRIYGCGSQIGRLKQCWIGLPAEKYSKIHSKYKKEHGKLIWKKLQLFQKIKPKQSVFLTQC